MPFVSVLHVDELGAVDWPKAEEYRPVTPGLVAQAGDLLISLLNPRFLRAAVVPERYEAVQCSAEFGVFQAKCDPYAVLALLHDPQVAAQLAPLGRGTSSSRRRIQPDDVLSVLIPPVTSTWLAERDGAVRNAMDQYTSAHLQLAALYG